MSVDGTKNNCYSLTAAIDFGTTFSGYGYSMKNSVDEITINDITVNKEWRTEVYKTPTSVLINGKGEFVAFGFEAENKYSRLTKEQIQNHNLFRHFKMMLYHEKKLSRSTTITSITGKNHRALDIFAMSLCYLKQHLTKQVEIHDGSPPQNEKIRWVLTIPAIWNDKAKQFMREAALEAGLISSKDSKQLVLTLEPEAASVLFRELEVNHYTEVPTQMMETSFSTGTRYMIIDAGGGTIDITVHEILDKEGNIEELIPATGGNWGGNEVNKLFEELLYKILGEKFMNAYKKDYPVKWLKLQNTFEKAKRELDISLDNRMQVDFPFGMEKAYSKIANSDIEEDITEADSSHGVYLAGEGIVLDENCINKLFDSVIAKTVARVKAILDVEEVGKLQYIVLAGGFGESKLLFNRLKKEFKDSATVISPVSAGLSIIKGAVLFAYNPSVIKVRRMRKTYGYCVDKIFEGVHDISRKFTDERGDVRCHDCFATFVQKNESVELNYVKTFSGHPAQKKNVFINFQIYSTDSIDVIYDNDDRLTKVGVLTFDIPPVNRDEKDTRKYKISVKFGGTEIEVEVCITTANGKETKTLAIDYFK